MTQMLRDILVEKFIPRNTTGFYSVWILTEDRFDNAETLSPDVPCMLYV